MQAELPVWLTTAGNPDTYRQAGELGVSILTHLPGADGRRGGDQSGALPRGPAARRGITARPRLLMLHTFLGESKDAVREVVREPMKAYLRSSLGLIRGFASSWTAYKRGAGEQAPLEELSADEMEDLLEYSFERYFEASTLFGTVDDALQKLTELEAIGIDEVACLIDFGVPAETTIRHLSYLGELRAKQSASSSPSSSLPELILAMA